MEAEIEDASLNKLTEFLQRIPGVDERIGAGVRFDGKWRVKLTMISTM